jgi:homocysteine S-methyltransferase
VLRTQPDRVRAVHASYLDAGADCLLTASYQVSAMGFRELGLPRESAADMLRRSVQLAEEARDGYRRSHIRPIWIAASLGPYGGALHNGAEFHGNYDCTFDDLVAFHRERLLVLAETEADFFALETVPSREEARAIVEALHAVPGLPAYISFTCRDDRHVAHGEDLADCARLLDAEPQLVAIGVNCTAPPLIEPLVRQLKAATGKKIVVYPNSGEQWDGGTRSWTGESNPQSFGALALIWRQAGADWIGGCCRTGPDHVRIIADALAVSHP